jgi:hypothetical protein
MTKGKKYNLLNDAGKIIYTGIAPLAKPFLVYQDIDKKAKSKHKPNRRKKR